MDKFIGIDCGSSYIKAVLCDSSKNILLKTKVKTLFPVDLHVKNAINSLLKNENSNIPLCITGYGRHHIDIDAERLTEIRAHFIGSRSQITREKFTLIDIGGEDCKVIFINSNEIENFVMNRKCAAGTGAFLEEFASRLSIKIDDFNALAMRHDKELVLNSFCTVFAIQESIKLLMSGEKPENLIYSLYQSIAKRIMEMALINSGVVVFSGGVAAFNPILIDIFKKKLDKAEIFVLENSEFCGALGAALHLFERSKSCLQKE